MRTAFEAYFAESRRNRGIAKRPTFEQRDDGTYADDHTQRHWWTWQQAVRDERERCAKLCESTYPELRDGAIVQLPCFDGGDDCAAAIRMLPPVAGA